MGGYYYKTPLQKPPRKVHKQQVLIECRYIQLALRNAWSAKNNVKYWMHTTTVSTTCLSEKTAVSSLYSFSAHLFLFFSFSPCLGPCSYNSVPTFPPSPSSQDLHHAVYASRSSGFLLAWNKEKSGTLLYLWWSQGRGRTTFVGRNYVIERVTIISFIYFIYKMTSIFSNFRYLHLK